MPSDKYSNTSRHNRGHASGPARNSCKNQQHDHSVSTSAAAAVEELTLLASYALLGPTAPLLRELYASNGSPITANGLDCELRELCAPGGASHPPHGDCPMQAFLSFFFHQDMALLWRHFITSTGILFHLCYPRGIAAGSDAEGDRHRLAAAHGLLGSITPLGSPIFSRPRRGGGAIEWHDATLSLESSDDEPARAPLIPQPLRTSIDALARRSVRGAVLLLCLALMVSYLASRALPTLGNAVLSLWRRDARVIHRLIESLRTVTSFRRSLSGLYSAGALAALETAIAALTPLLGLLLLVLGGRNSLLLQQPRLLDKKLSFPLLHLFMRKYTHCPQLLRVLTFNDPVPASHIVRAQVEPSVREGCAAPCRSELTFIEGAWRWCGCTAQGLTSLAAAAMHGLAGLFAAALVPWGAVPMIGTVALAAAARDLVSQRAQARSITVSRCASSVLRLFRALLVMITRGVLLSTMYLIFSKAVSGASSYVLASRAAPDSEGARAGKKGSMNSLSFKVRIKLLLVALVAMLLHHAAALTCTQASLCGLGPREGTGALAIFKKLFKHHQESSNAMVGVARRTSSSSLAFLYIFILLIFSFFIRAAEKVVLTFYPSIMAFLQQPREGTDGSARDNTARDGNSNKGCVSDALLLAQKTLVVQQFYSRLRHSHALSTSPAPYNTYNTGMDSYEGGEAIINKPRVFMAGSSGAPIAYIPSSLLASFLAKEKERSEKMQQGALLTVEEEEALLDISSALSIKRDSGSRLLPIPTTFDVNAALKLDQCIVFRNVMLYNELLTFNSRWANDTNETFTSLLSGYGCGAADEALPDADRGDSDAGIILHPGTFNLCLRPGVPVLIIGPSSPPSDVPLNIGFFVMRLLAEYYPLHRGQIARPPLTNIMLCNMDDTYFAKPASTSPSVRFLHDRAGRDASAAVPSLLKALHAGMSMREALLHPLSPPGSGLRGGSLPSESRLQQALTEVFGQATPFDKYDIDWDKPLHSDLGHRLSRTDRRLLLIARAVLQKPLYLCVNGCLSALDDEGTGAASQGQGREQAAYRSLSNSHITAITTVTDPSRGAPGSTAAGGASITLTSTCVRYHRYIVFFFKEHDSRVKCSPPLAVHPAGRLNGPYHYIAGPYTVLASDEDAPDGASYACVRINYVDFASSLDNIGRRDIVLRLPTKY